MLSIGILLNIQQFKITNQIFGRRHMQGLLRPKESAWSMDSNGGESVYAPTDIDGSNHSLRHQKNCLAVAGDSFLFLFSKRLAG